MKTQWKNICFKVTAWLVSEVVLNLLGLDDLADYSEFVFDLEVTIANNHPQITLVFPPECPQFNHALPCGYTIGQQA
ncbi:MAG: hypothetical protein F6K36_27605 [Symploca sp. SIO3C6]|uniref:Uncharacterized protein n=1 Tax=Symploca sp. SIO1C4 TaxID=2607765 RepID=A0A6B3NF10_9CYAN|nr:hypothetical protein [Symploca sp. SIO3C6]NER28634.1 hypothetical protein [Symploca sp. SIO1C4]NET06520.1 hypothetical protein [Symploca sp. SIO2B6]